MGVMESFRFDEKRFKTYKSWEKHYKSMGLSYHKLQTVMHRKMRRLGYYQ